MEIDISVIKQKAAEILSQVACIIGYRDGIDPLHAAPVFVRKPEQIEKLQWNRFCIHNLSTYLLDQKQGPGGLWGPHDKVAVLMKGCDTRSVIHLLGEGLISRDKLVIIGVPCSGMIDITKIRKRVDINQVNQLGIDNQTIMVFTETEEVSADINDFLYDKCKNCEFPNPLIYDSIVGDPVDINPQARTFSQLEILDRMTLQERGKFWEREFSRCIRCNACRNVCPICYCQNQCLLETRIPRWVKEGVDSNNNLWYHVTRAYHLAGRCTECGECSRVCPVNIPINLLPMKMNQELYDLFGWRSGIKEGVKPPLMDFKLDEDRI